MRLQETLTLAYFERLVSSPAGRAHVLATCADAESSDEGALFDRLLTWVEDDELAKLVKRHQEDELRHADLFRACLARTGVPAPVVPEHLKLLKRIDDLLGGMMEKPMTSRTDVMRAYLLLQVIEERASTQFGLHVRAYRKVDPQTADIVEQIAKDEARHLKYCRAISQRYAPDEATLRRELTRFREVEGRAFAANSRANMDYVRERGLVNFGPLEGLFWRGVRAVTGRVQTSVPTPFWTESAAAA
jgi:demethoxyubiquinone hydroxylase (CLK1/Coq7/Cat5 family)